MEDNLTFQLLGGEFTVKAEYTNHLTVLDCCEKASEGVSDYFKKLCRERTLNIQGLLNRANEFALTIIKSRAQIYFDFLMQNKISDVTIDHIVDDITSKDFYADAVADIRNLYNDICTERGGARIKMTKLKKLYEDPSTVDSIANGVRVSIFSYCNDLERIMRDRDHPIYIPDKEALNEADALLQNLKTASIPQEDKNEISLKILHLHPFCSDIYSYIFSEGDIDTKRTITAVAKVMRIDLDRMFDVFTFGENSISYYAKFIDSDNIPPELKDIVDRLQDLKSATEIKDKLNYAPAKAGGFSCNLKLRSG